jgi:signal peptidase I
MSQTIYYTKAYTIQKTGIVPSFSLSLTGFFRLIKRVLEVTLRTTLLLAFIITAFTVVTSYTDLLFGIRSYTVLTGSMDPTIPVGSIIYNLKNLGYNVGDVVTFKTGKDILVTHRIVEVMSNGEVMYLTKGDANSVPDSSYITADKIIGKTYLSIPFIGRAAGMLKTPSGLLTAVFLPAAVIILFELWNIKKEIEKSVEKRILSRVKQEGGVPPHSQLWSESLA